jgi:type I restriction enzyme M protein
LLINRLLSHIEDANKGKLHNMFRHIDYNSEADLGPLHQRNLRLKNLLEDLNGLDLRPASLERSGVIGELCEALIEKFTATAGKKYSPFHTPAAVCETLARLVAPKPGDCICDPACGSGALLIQAGKQVGSDDYALYGQEINGSTWALCKMNMFLHGLDTARIEWEDTLRHPQFVEEKGGLKQFDVVVANPLFSLDQWGQEIAAEDPFNRFYRGIPSKTEGEWAFICHMLATAAEGSGRVGVAASHGVLFRGGQEGVIREAVIRENWVETVIGLPANLFCGTDIPMVLIRFDKSRPKGGKGDVLFIDASRQYEPRASQNAMRPQNFEKILDACHQRRNLDQYAYLATYNEIEENHFNLNLARYVNTFEPEAPVDLKDMQTEIEAIEKELTQTQARMKVFLKELGFFK